MYARAVGSHAVAGVFMCRVVLHRACRPAHPRSAGRRLDSASWSEPPGNQVSRSRTPVCPNGPTVAGKQTRAQALLLSRLDTRSSVCRAQRARWRAPRSSIRGKTTGPLRVWLESCILIAPDTMFDIGNLATAQAVIAMTSLAGGLCLVGVVVHVQNDPMAFTSAPATDHSALADVDVAPMEVAVDPDVPAILPTVRGERPVMPRHRVTPRHASRPRLAEPCQPTWHDLETGPAGRRMLITCPNTSDSAEDPARPDQHTRPERLRVSGPHLARLTPGWARR